jgi:hypothetical protein
METYWGVPADSIDFALFWRFVWERRRELRRFLAWAERMQ